METQVNPGVHTGMAQAIVNMSIQCTLICIPGPNIPEIFNAFPTIGLTFAILAAAFSKNATKYEAALRFAKRARSMNIAAWIVNGISIIVGLIIMSAL